MNYPQNCGKKMVAVAGAILLCGSMGLAQAGQQPSGAAGQTPGQNNPRYGFTDECHERAPDRTRPWTRCS